MSNKLKFNPVTGKLDLVEEFDASEIEKDPEVRQETLDALTDSKQANEGDTLTVDEHGQSKWKEGFNPKGNYPNLSVGFAHDITPEEVDAISDNTAFVWQTSGGSANIPASSTAIIKKICGTTIDNPSTGKKISFTATHIVSRIYNLFNYEDETLIIHDKVLTSSGAIQDDEDNDLYIVPVLRAGDNNGYVVTYNPAVEEPAEIDNMGYSTNKPTEETESVNIIQLSSHGNSMSYYPNTSDSTCGYLVFSYPKGKADEICIHFAWSGYNDDKFAPYEENILQLPEIVETRGLLGIGSVYDEINQQTYIQRIGVVDSSTLTWERWTEQVWDVTTQSYIEQFYGYKASNVENIAKDSNTITSDMLFGLYNWNTDEDGVLRVMADDEDPETLEQLTNGVNIYFELETPITTPQEWSGLLVVGDFGDIRFFGVPYISAMGGGGYMLPSVVQMKYGINYRDTIRNLANSGVTFTGQGVVTSGLYFGQPITNQNISGSLTWNLEDIQKVMQITLTGASTITLPNGGSRPFDFKLKVIQDATGGRALTIASADSTNVFNINDFDFSAGQANQRCIVALSWDGSEWWFSCSEYFGE